MESAPVDSPPLLLLVFPCRDAAAVFVADCVADSPIITGTTNGELLLVDESSEGVPVPELALAVGNKEGGTDPRMDLSPRKCPPVDKNGARGNIDDNEAPLRLAAS